MSERACWIIIKSGCDAAQIDDLGSLLAQQNALWYEEQLAKYGPEVTAAEEAQIGALAQSIADLAQQKRHKAKQLETLLKNKASSEG